MEQDNNYDKKWSFSVPTQRRVHMPGVPAYHHRRVENYNNNFNVDDDFDNYSNRNSFNHDRGYTNTVSKSFERKIKPYKKTDKINEYYNNFTKDNNKGIYHKSHNNNSFYKNNNKNFDKNYNQNNNQNNNNNTSYNSKYKTRRFVAKRPGTPLSDEYRRDNHHAGYEDVNYFEKSSHFNDIECFDETPRYNHYYDNDDVMYQGEREEEEFVYEQYADTDGYNERNSYNGRENNNSSSIGKYYSRRNSGANNSNYVKPEKYEREFFSTNVRKRRRSTIDSLEGEFHSMGDVGARRDARSSLSPKSPVEHDDVGMDDDKVFSDTQLSFDEISMDDEGDEEYSDHDEEKDVYTEPSENTTIVDNNNSAKTVDKQITKSLLEEFGISITDIADYLRRQIAEKEKNGSLTLNQLLEEKFLSTTDSSSKNNQNVEEKKNTEETHNPPQRKRSSSPIMFDRSWPSEKDSGTESSKSESSKNGAKGTLHSKQEEHSEKDRLSKSPSSIRSLRREKRDKRKSEKVSGCRSSPSPRDHKKSHSPYGRYHTVKSSHNRHNHSYGSKIKISKRSSLYERRHFSRYDKHMDPVKRASIAEFLLRAGDRYVDEFKKHQASQFIVTKLQTAHFQTMSSLTQVTFPAAPLTIPRQHLFAIPVPRPIETPVATTPVATTPVFIPIKTPVSTPDFVPLVPKTNDDMKTKQSVNDAQGETELKHLPPVKNESPTTSTIDETLSFLRKASSSGPQPPTIDDDNLENKENDNKVYEESTDDEVSITRVVDAKKGFGRVNTTSTVAPISTIQTVEKQAVKDSRKVFLGENNNKYAAKRSSAGTVKNVDQTSATTAKETNTKTRVRVPSWFNARLIELFKQRHKKKQQLKRAKQDPAIERTHLKGLQQSLCDIDSEFEPLYRKTKEEFLKQQNSGSRNSTKK